eukprot:scaffold7233_cov39-Tisochrysis_lutea.AAC.1
MGHHSIEPSNVHSHYKNILTGGNNITAGGDGRHAEGKRSRLANEASTSPVLACAIRRESKLQDAHAHSMMLHVAIAK